MEGEGEVLALDGEAERTLALPLTSGSLAFAGEEERRLSLVFVD